MIILHAIRSVKAGPQARAAVASHSDVQLIGGGSAYPGAPPRARLRQRRDDLPPIGQPGVDVYDSSLPAGARPRSRSCYACFLARFQQQLAHNHVRAINYLSLPLDHTQGVIPGARTPSADVADDDWALGQIVDTISHSPTWSGSLILVLEDDAQDGADHIDAHRIAALVISPYTQAGGPWYTDRYNELSFLRTMEVIAGLGR